MSKPIETKNTNVCVVLLVSGRLGEGVSTLMGLRFLHTADLHLGSPLQGLGKDISTSVLERLRHAVDTSFERIVDAALFHNVEFITIAGDLLDSRAPSMRSYFILLRGFERLRDAGIRVYLSHGNHDPLLGPTPLAWPDNVHVFEASPRTPTENYQADTVWHHSRDGWDVQISGFSYPQAQMLESLASAFVRQPAAHFAIGLYHGMVGASSEHDNYCRTDIQALIQTDFDFWGLGHIHQPGILHALSPVVAYPGNPQGRHARETGLRGCLLVDADQRKSVTLTRLELCQVVWQQVQVDLTGVISLPEAFSSIQQTIRSATTTFADREYIIRLKLTGMTPVCRMLRQDDRWQEAVREATAQWGIPVVLERIDDDLRPPVDVDTLVQSPEFIGEFLRLVRGYQADLVSFRGEAKPWLQEVFHAKNELPFDQLDDAMLSAWLTEVEQLLVAYVADQEDVG